MKAHKKMYKAGSSAVATLTKDAKKNVKAGKCVAALRSILAAEYAAGMVDAEARAGGGKKRAKTRDAVVAFGKGCATISAKSAKKAGVKVSMIKSGSTIKGSFKVSKKKGKKKGKR
jgi:hypothetical protein